MDDEVLIFTDDKIFKMVIGDTNYTIENKNDLTDTVIILAQQEDKK